MRHEYKISSCDYADIKAHIEGPKLQSVMFEIYNEFRKKSKYNEDGTGSWSEAYDVINNILSMNNIDLFE